jgi:N-acyl-D-aspartate/D-glutamate deacylase
MVADIAVFDPATVRGNSTYEVAWKPTTGMAAVLVNGTVVVRDDRVLPVFPGQPLRFDSTGPRFETLSNEQWVDRFMVGVARFRWKLIRPVHQKSYFAAS